MLDKQALLTRLKESYSQHIQNTYSLYQALHDFFAQEHKASIYAALLRKRDYVCPINALWRPSSALYTVHGVDGSQIYPDRHYTAGWYVLNGALVTLQYGYTSSCMRKTLPEVYPTILDTNELATPEYVNWHRSALEYTLPLLHAKPHDIVLFDGSLVFWHLHNSGSAHVQHFQKMYVDAFQQYYQRGIICAGYVSAPRTRDVVKIFLSLYPDASLESAICNDTFFLKELLEHGQVLGWFSAGHEYDAAENMIQPYFAYLRWHDDIIRIEVPRWIAASSQLSRYIFGALVDQLQKGNGYPVALAQAHNAAAIRAIDQVFFHEMVQRIIATHEKAPSATAKGASKKLL